MFFGQVAGAAVGAERAAAAAAVGRAAAPEGSLARASERTRRRRPAGAEAVGARRLPSAPGLGT